MGWEKFVKKEERDKTDSLVLAAKSAKTMAEIVVEDSDSYFVLGDRKRLLPIHQVGQHIGETQQGKKEYLVANDKVALLLNEHLEITRFFRIPGVIPESLVYFGDGLFAGIARNREEVLSFTLGGPKTDSEFSIGNYSVCIRLEECGQAYADGQFLYVEHKHGICVLKPVLG
ncbi:hypothetical protein NEHOM01_1626 [Nematocida homosporus]|uniref:uncharacterized protein n=1 Tax=Nematocida homosporus TaxID=1912981 RepID=UPI00221FA5A2|nr:uncharacterized protein NEHOM01_1626 [Nematocida homosporus]KAI5186673.1 hypothetical protein NEHOM01_1626 [Nematocida homosporus]